MTLKRYYLGCPIWGNREWVGSFFTPNARPKDFLAQYSTVFNTVEGNNTFYGLPTPEAVQNWHQQTPAHFRFSFKIPKIISHEKQLKWCEKTLDEFLTLLAPLEQKFKMMFLQLPPYFSPKQMGDLQRFLKMLPSDKSCAVEVRHPDFFADANAKNELHALLKEAGANLVVFDTAVLHGLRSNDPLVMAAQKRKPNQQADYTVTAKHPFLRFIGHNEVAPNKPHLEKLAGVVAAWIRRECEPFVYFHSPDDLYAPEIAKAFHHYLQQQLPDVDLGALPAFPGEGACDTQLSLF
jgi:uncharacterized protein YecE (DUF72 family)